MLKTDAREKAMRPPSAGRTRWSGVRSLAAWLVPVVLLAAIASFSGFPLTRSALAADRLTTSQIRASLPLIQNLAAQSVLIAQGATWKYLDNGSNAGTAWRVAGFNDTTWRSGPAHLGYGDGDEATVVRYGPDPNNRYITTYFRRTFQITDRTQWSALSLRVLRDDGAIVYLNGREIYRSNMPAGTVTYTSRASSGISGAGEISFNTVAIDPALLVNGSNVLGIEVHQAAANSPDLSFDLALSGTVSTVAPTATRAPTNTPAPVATATPRPTATPTARPTAAPDPAFPIRAAFYYPWFPEAWTQLGIYPYTKYHPSAGYYNSSDAALIKKHIAAMQYGNISVGIASWWGQGKPTDSRVPALLSAAAGTGFRWAVYYEHESEANPSVAELTSDLTYLRDRYSQDPGFLKIGGKFVVFVYTDGADACSMAARWKQANTVGAYIVLKVFANYTTCAYQPEGWHQYAPAMPADQQGQYSYAISPGFNKVGEAVRLARDTARWSQNVRDMVASGARFQLVTTFDEWGEGTSVESATEWASPSGYGTYLDALHNNGQP